MPKSSTIGELLLKKSKQFAGKNAIGWIENKDVRFYSFEQYFQTCEHLANALHKISISKRERIAILSSTRKEWHFFDMASLASGLVVVPIYPSNLPHEVEFILNHSETKVLVVENAIQLRKVLEVQKNLKSLEHIISIETIEEKDIQRLDDKIVFHSYGEMLRNGSIEKVDGFFIDTINQISGSDLASIIYTSGTTGEPKGASISHNAFTTMINNLSVSLKGSFTENDRSLVFLPLSHVLGRCDSMLHLTFNLEVVYAQSIDKVIENISIVKPTLMIAVPRIFEKIHAKVLEQLHESTPIKKQVFEWAQKASNDYFETIQMDRSPSTFSMVQRELAYNLVFKKIYEKFGGKLRFFVSGGAPLAVEIMKFLRNANLTVLEGYGLTETIAPCFVNPPRKQIPGTVGIPLGDVKIKFADDGEIMIKSEAMFSEYYKNKKATSEAFEDGWFKTGDIGILTNDGYLKITDRKKDIIITSAGKNVAPQKLENMLKMQKHITHAMVVGDKKNYLTVVIGIEKEIFMNDIESWGIDKSISIQDLSNENNVLRTIKEEVENVNSELASYETIKYFYIAPMELTIEGGHLTPSLKLKKKFLMTEFASEIEKMYSQKE